jgi:hypothetical protein
MTNGRMRMLRIVPVHKTRHPFPNMHQISEAERIVDPILQGFKERFDERIVVADPFPAFLLELTRTNCFEIPCKGSDSKCI